MCFHQFFFAFQQQAKKQCFPLLFLGLLCFGLVLLRFIGYYLRGYNYHDLPEVLDSVGFFGFVLIVNLMNVAVPEAQSPAPRPPVFLSFYYFLKAFTIFLQVFTMFLKVFTITG